MATNKEIVVEALQLNGDMFVLKYDGTNLNTFAEWKKRGYSVKKGEKAYLTVDLWKPFEKEVEKEKDGKKVKEKETRFMLKTCHLFRNDQVEKTTKQATYKKKTKAS